MLLVGVISIGDTIRVGMGSLKHISIVIIPKFKMILEFPNCRRNQISKSGRSTKKWGGPRQKTTLYGARDPSVVYTVSSQSGRSENWSARCRPSRQWEYVRHLLTRVRVFSLACCSHGKRTVDQHEMRFRLAGWSAWPFVSRLLSERDVQLAGIPVWDMSQQWTRLIRQ